jgi:integrase
MLTKWLDDMHLAGVTRDGYRRCFRTMFQYGVDEKIMEHNPAAEIKAIKCDEKLPTPFSASDVAAVMAAAESVAPVIVPTLAVQFFAGLRPGEAKGLRWENINFNEGFIRVMPETSKVRAARIVDLTPTLLKWLLPCRQPAGPIGIKTQNQFDYYMTRAGENHKGVIGQAGVKWIQDGPRKTFATMHFAVNQDAAKLAAILGHVNGQDVLYKHYRGLTTRKEAEKYWEISPTREMGKVIQFPQQKSA